MNAIDLAKDIVDRLVVALPSVKCRYEYVEISDTHMIEVLPLSVYKGEAFENTAEPLLMEFIGHFPGESLCFISDESLSSIENSMFEATGSQYHFNEGEEVLYQAVKASSEIKKKVEVRISSASYKRLAKKFSVSDDNTPNGPDYAMAA